MDLKKYIASNYFSNLHYIFDRNRWNWGFSSIENNWIWVLVYFLWGHSIVTRDYYELYFMLILCSFRWHFLILKIFKNEEEVSLIPLFKLMGIEIIGLLIFSHTLRTVSGKVILYHRYELTAYMNHIVFSHEYMSRIV